jgi:hypothetical protein
MMSKMITMMTMIMMMTKTITMMTMMMIDFLCRFVSGVAFRDQRVGGRGQWVWKDVITASYRWLVETFCR